MPDTNVMENTLIAPASQTDADDPILPTDEAQEIDAATSALLNQAAAAPVDAAMAPEDAFVKSTGMYHEQKSEQEILQALREQWTKTLEQFPISEAYAASREGVSFTARTLASLQRRVEIEIEEFKPLEAELERLPVNKVVHFIEATMDKQTAYGPLGVPPTFETLLTELCGPQQIGEPMWDQFSNTMSDPNTTLEQVKELYVALYEEARLAPGKSWVMSVAALLQDILQGRASKSTAEK